MEECLKYYQLPFKPLFGRVSIITSLGSKAYDVVCNLNKECFEQLLATLNGTSEKKVNGKVDNDGTIIRIDQRPILNVRGWGRLVGPGGFGLSGEKATEIQNQFVQWTVKQLNQDVEIKKTD